MQPGIKKKRTQIKPYKKRHTQHQDKILALHSYQDGDECQKLISASTDGKIIQLDVKAKEFVEIDIKYPYESLISDFKDSKKELEIVQYLKSDNILSTSLIAAIGYENGLIQIKDLYTGDAISVLFGHLNFIQTLYFCENSLFSGSTDCMIREWDMKDNYICKNIYKFNDPIQKIQEYFGYQGVFTSIISYKDKFLITGQDDGSVKFWNIKTKQIIEDLPGHLNAVTSFTFLDNYLYSGSLDHSILCWNLNEIEIRIIEREAMQYEDLLSKKIEVFQRYISSKTKKKGKGKAKKKK
ncbi:wd40 repeat-containing protein [Stylonychia lemnae]|uniref:Wd40 repeat-containing protein n=1 Tax=Stylonychia lemnae TaxID=5949 RepID=A0A077ZZB2_STYLE|nr:wd40 repeat-containing protein [Stylonychia lemnae]|eukprot:CDW73833.1 wd40 repeat-containing protein [Stylonychia lemnae]